MGRYISKDRKTSVHAHRWAGLGDKHSHVLEHRPWWHSLLCRPYDLNHLWYVECFYWGEVTWVREGDWVLGPGVGGVCTVVTSERFFFLCDKYGLELEIEEEGVCDADTTSTQPSP